MAEVLTGKRLAIMNFITECIRERGYPPSVREIGEAVGLASSATVHSHLAVLQKEGFLKRAATKGRAMTVSFDPSSHAALPSMPTRSVPLIGSVAAGTGVLAQENVEELFALPEEFTGSGETFMLKVRGDSMVEAGIFDGDYVVVRHQPEANDGDIVVSALRGLVSYWYQPTAPWHHWNLTLMTSLSSAKLSLFFVASRTLPSTQSDLS